jgi:hypothetical protein
MLPVALALSLDERRLCLTRTGMSGLWLYMVALPPGGE